MPFADTTYIFLSPTLMALGYHPVGIAPINFLLLTSKIFIEFVPAFDTKSFPPFT